MDRAKPARLNSGIRIMWDGHLLLLWPENGHDRRAGGRVLVVLRLARPADPDDRRRRHGAFQPEKDQAYDRAGRMTQITDNLSDSTACVYNKVSRTIRDSHLLFDA